MCCGDGGGPAGDGGSGRPAMEGVAGDAGDGGGLARWTEALGRGGGLAHGRVLAGRRSWRRGMAVSQAGEAKTARDGEDARDGGVAGREACSSRSPERSWGTPESSLC